MTFWIDANLDPKLADWLGARFKIIAKPLREIDLHEADDDTLIAAARRFGSIVMVTKDADFSEYARRNGSPPQVVWLRCGNISTFEMQAWLSGTFAAALQRIEQGEACVEIPFASA